MIIASIDIGSNSVLLLIAEVDISQKIIKHSKTFYETPRVSEGLNSSGIINETRMEVLFTVLSKYKSIIDEYKPDAVLVTATKAFRVAKNAEIITNRIKDQFGWTTKVITGDEEAKLTFLGTVHAPSIDDDSFGVIDIGGGSTEIVIGNYKDILFENSFDTGVVSLTEKFFAKNPPSSSEIKSAIERLKKLFVSLPHKIENSSFYAVAGTPTTLACIVLGKREFSEELLDNFVLQLNDVQRIRKELSSKSSDDILEDYGKIVEGREDVLLAGTLILEQVMERLGISQVLVSTRGLRFGVIYNYLNWV